MCAFSLFGGTVCPRPRWIEPCRYRPTHGGGSSGGDIYFLVKCFSRAADDSGVLHARAFLGHFKRLSRRALMYFLEKLCWKILLETAAAAAVVTLSSRGGTCLSFVSLEYYCCDIGMPFASGTGRAGVCRLVADCCWL